MEPLIFEFFKCFIFELLSNLVYVCFAFRRLMVLEDQHKQAMDELVDKRETLRARPSASDMKRDQTEIKLLENRLDKALHSFNDVQSQNKQLRKDIDVWRKQ